MKERLNLVIMLALTIGLSVAAWLSWLVFRPADPVAVIVRRPRAEKEQKTSPPAQPPPSKLTRSARVDLRRAAPPSAAALAQVEAGRLIVRTTVPFTCSLSEILRQLVLRGGIFVLEDADGAYWWLKSRTERLPLAKAGLPLENYALNRPRTLSHNEVEYTGGHNIGAGERLFIVMPVVFEGGILSEIEQVVAEPLANFNSADVVIDTTPGGYLELTLTAVEHRQRGALRMRHRFRGL